MPPPTQPGTIIYFFKVDAGEIGSERIAIWYALVVARAEGVCFTSMVPLRIHLEIMVSNIYKETYDICGSPR